MYVGSSEHAYTLECRFSLNSIVYICSSLNGAQMMNLVVGSVN